MKNHILLGFGLSLALFLNQARATVTTWDPQGTTGGTITSPTSGGYTGSLSQTWENPVWSTSQSGQATPQNWVENTAALFACQANGNTPAFTVTMNTNHTVAGIFNGPLTPDPCNVTITGSGIITIGGPGGTLFANLQGFSVSSDTGDPGTLVISNVIAGTAASSGALTPEYGGTISLYGANTYSSGTALGYSGVSWTGTINFNNPASFGTGPILFTNTEGGTLAVQGSSAITIANNFTNVMPRAFNGVVPLSITGNAAGVTFSGFWNMTGPTIATNPLAPLSLTCSGAATTLVTISGVISGTNGISKNGAGMLQVTGPNTYGKAGTVLGTTWISNGWFIAANTSGSATGVSSVEVVSTGTLTGSGTISGTVTNSANISATNMSGGCATLTTGSETWESTATNVWAINDPTGTAGASSGWDEIAINGTLTIPSTFTINVTSLTSANKQGTLTGFVNTSYYSWPILTASGGISGFNAANVTINTGKFSNPLGSGQFTVTVSGNTMYLNFGQAPSLSSVSPGVQVVANGNAAVFTATASGSGFSYIWELNGGALTADASGATTSALTISPAGDADAGSYTCIVSNAIGSVSSGGTNYLIVVDPPSFTGPVGDGEFTLNFSGPVGRSYRVWSTNVLSSLPVTENWNFVGSGVFTSGVNSFTDDNADDPSAEFYAITRP